MSKSSAQLNQYALFDAHQVPPACAAVVNVASVPQRSPFRYPGGKTWLTPHIRAWLRASKPRTFIEPFAGGGSVSLAVAFEHLAEHVIMVELDPDVAAVWQTILEDDSEWLVQHILNFSMSVDSVRAELAAGWVEQRQRAFLTILRNRVCHGGILAPGSGMINRGENGKGIASRWYPETLAKRIRAIRLVSDRVTFIHGDGVAVIQQFAQQADAAFFIDPPYTAPGKRAGKRLYVHNELDHDGLFELAATVAGDFLMTYDNADSVRVMADRHAFHVSETSMKGTHHNRLTELLIRPSQHIL